MNNNLEELMINTIENFILDFNENTILDFNDKLNLIKQNLDIIIDLLNDGSVFGDYLKRVIV